MSTIDAPVRILGVPGSLRANSFNRRLLEIARKIAPAALDIRIYEELGSVPLFNEDLEADDGTPPAEVLHFRNAVQDADAILIATPEYNQSMPGVLKNAIDWLSRSAPVNVLVDKPVALCGITVGEWGTRLSQAALRQTLFACGAQLQPLHLYLRKAQTLLPGDAAHDRSVETQLASFLEALSGRLAPQARQRPPAN